MDETLSKLLEINSLLDSHNLKIVLLLAVGLTIASILGYCALRLKISPILGYLLAGFLIGPYSPGFVADLKVSDQLAEIGVVLMMFGVGLNFRLQELLSVKKIAIPGAIIQTLIAALICALVVHAFGWTMITGIILGLSIGVASTVVLVRMLADNRLLKSKEGHISVGWLIVEDIITVVILIFLPNLSSFQGNDFSLHQLLTSLSIVFIKFTILAIILLTFGHKIISYILAKVLNTHSHELFTLSVLALIFAIAIGATFLFGITIALGAFIAGMIIGQTEVRHKALVHSMPMKDAFIAIFFLSVGMLFDPSIIVRNFPLFISIFAIIIFVKPLTAFLITIGFRYPVRTALTVAAGLAQIGEFSFILSEEALKYGLLPDDGYDIIVACALISIALNPLFFKLIHPRQASAT